MQRVAPSTSSSVADEALLVLRWRDADGLPLDAVSDGVAAVLGGPPASLAPASLAEVLHPDDRARFLDEVARARTRGAGRVRHADHRVIGRDGRVAWWQTVTVLRTGPDGVERCVSHAFDVTDADPRPEDETLRLLLHAMAHSPQAVVITDVAGTVRYVNPRFTVMTGVPAAAVTDLDGFVRGFGGPVAETLGALWRALSAGERWLGEFAAVRPDGGVYWIAMKASPMRDADGRVVNLAATAEDITERRQAEEHIRRAQKMQAVGVLAGGVAHDFNNILTVILGYSHLALDALPEGSEPRDDVAQIATAANRAKGLVQQLLTFSRKEAAGREPVDLRAVVEDALHLVHPAIPAAVEIRLEAEDGPMPVLASAMQIQQTVINLCRNAVDAIAEGGGDAGGTITVSLSHVAAEPPKAPARAPLAPGRHIRLGVADTGCGMDPATVERMFEPFFTTKAVDKGTGLGLAAVHGIVADHGGVIDVESAPGRGTTVAIHLPVFDAAAGHRTVGPRGSGRVLLVDADAAMCAMSGRLLRSRGFRTVATVNSRRALALFVLAPERFDLVVLVQRDAAEAWKLLTLARAFAASSPGIPILVCADADLAVEGAATHAAGVTRVVRTPVEPTSFVTLVDRMVGERRDSTKT
ncbi:MAG TPA: ATP-binding protein [Azospirillum sp.]